VTVDDSAQVSKFCFHRVIKEMLNFIQCVRSIIGGKGGKAFFDIPTSEHVLTIY
jgi:hypothetical protein